MGLDLELGGLVAILLDARGAQAGKTVLIDGQLPRQEFVDSQRIATAGFFQREQTATNGSYNFRLAPDDPAFGGWGRQIRNGQRAAIRPNYIFDPRAVGFGHAHYSHYSTDQTMDEH